MMQLKCQNCGGVLEFEEDDVIVTERFVMWRPRDKTLTCQSCGSKFMRGDDLNVDKGTGGDIVVTGDDNIVVGSISNSSGVVIGGGNVVIGGDVVGGNLIVTGSGNRIVRRTDY